MNTQQLQDMNADIETVKIKGKNYAMVFERIKALRKVIPNASIETEVVHIEDGSIIIRATVRDDDGHIIGTTALSIQTARSRKVTKRTRKS